MFNYTSLPHNSFLFLANQYGCYHWHGLQLDVCKTGRVT